MDLKIESMMSELQVKARAVILLREDHRAFGARPRPSRAAIFTKSAREWAFIFCIILLRCAFTVISLIPSSAPTCLFKRPETTKAITSRSRPFVAQWLLNFGNGVFQHSRTGKS